MKLQKTIGCLLASGVLLCAPAVQAEAQVQNGQWRLPIQASVRTGVQTPPPAPTQPTVIVVMPPALRHRQIFPCAGMSAAPRAHRVIASNGVVLSRPAAPTYTQPVPNQQTASQQNLPSVQSARAMAREPRTVIVSGATFLPCFTRDAAGRVVILR